MLGNLTDSILSLHNAALAGDFKLYSSTVESVLNQHFPSSHLFWYRTQLSNNSLQIINSIHPTPAPGYTQLNESLKNDFCTSAELTKVKLSDQEVIWMGKLSASGFGHIWQFKSICEPLSDKADQLRLLLPHLEESYSALTFAKVNPIDKQGLVSYAILATDLTLLDAADNFSHYFKPVTKLIEDNKQNIHSESKIFEHPTGQFHINKSQQRFVVEVYNNPISKLTQKEQAIVKLLQQGKTDKQMATNMEISQSTVNNHLNSIYKKLQVTSRAQLLVSLANGGEVDG